MCVRGICYSTAACQPAGLPGILKPSCLLSVVPCYSQDGSNSPHSFLNTKGEVIPYPLQRGVDWNRDISVDEAGEWPRS